MVEPLRGDVAQHVAHRRVLLRGLVHGGPGVARSGRRLEPALDPGAFLGHDVLELRPDVAEHIAKLVAIEQLIAPALQPLEQVVEAREILARGVGSAPAALDETPQRLPDVALGHHVLGERVDDLVRLEIHDGLRAVPARVASPPGERTVGGRRLSPGRRAQMTGVGGVARHGVSASRACRPGSGPC